MQANVFSRSFSRPFEAPTVRRAAAWLLVGAAACTSSACTSSGSNGGSTGQGSGDGGEGGSQVPGDATSVWQATSAQLSVLDTTNPGNFKQETVPLPAKSVDGASGRTAELYRKLEGDVLVTFAHYDGDDVYYRITQKCTMSDTTCTVLWDDISMQFSFADGKLEQTSQHLIGNEQVVTATTTFSAVPFPPPGWPTQAVTQALGASQ